MSMGRGGGREGGGGGGREGEEGEREGEGREISTILASCPPRRAVLVFQSTMNLGLSACMTNGTH